MKSKSIQTARLVEDCAYQAVHKHFKKSVKHEQEVLDNLHPEPLHQMRVGMRRLRTALQVFEPALLLPKAASGQQIQKIAQCLGKLRDLHVLNEKLETHYRPLLSEQEQSQLDEILKHLRKRQAQRFAQVKKMLGSDRYHQFKRAFQDWLNQPEYEAIAPLSIAEVLPDLLLPLISHLLLHPGWLVGAKVEAGAAQLNLDFDPTQLPCHADQEANLHDLRKQMKRVRYQTEFFVEHYGTEFRMRVSEFQSAQEILGQLQDCSIMSDFFEHEIKGNWQDKMPTLVQQIQQERISAWQQWQPLQQQYLQPNFRSALRNLLLHPSLYEDEPIQEAQPLNPTVAQHPK